jgi:hypothetical protein
MTTLRVLLLSDGRPGHYHLAEGVIAALERRHTVEVERLEIERLRLVPARLLAGLAFSPALVLRLGYGIAPRSLPPADLVVSAGGDTIAANAAAARALGACNVFCGTLRKLPPEAFSLIVSSYARHERLPRHLVTLKPNKMDPDALGRPPVTPRFGEKSPPRLVGLLIGGDSGLFHYEAAEWDRLLAFARELSSAWGTRFLVSTSRRTPAHAADAAVRLAADTSVVAELIDYRTAGPGTLPRILGAADAIICTEDSSTMISEAVSVRLPVIGVSPVRHSFKPEEAEYRDLMRGRDWCRFLGIADLSVARFAEALGAITPLQGNHIERLAEELARRLPGLGRR